MWRSLVRIQVGPPFCIEVSNQPIWNDLTPNAAGLLSTPSLVLELQYAPDGSPLLETAIFKPILFAKADEAFAEAAPSYLHLAAA